jgi:hypothetical protein
MMQGPLGQAMNNYKTMGMPDQLVQFLSNVAQIPPDKMKKMLEDGTIPNFEKLAQIIGQEMAGQKGQGQIGEGEGPSPVDQADVGVKAAQAKKIEAETALIIEKIASERLKQEQVIAGVKFDKEKLRLERAKVIAGVEVEIHRSIQMNKAGQGVNNEKGLKTNNKEE